METDVPARAPSPATDPRVGCFAALPVNLQAISLTVYAIGSRLFCIGLCSALRGEPGIRCAKLAPSHPFGQSGVSATKAPRASLGQGANEVLLVVPNPAERCDHLEDLFLKGIIVSDKARRPAVVLVIPSGALAERYIAAIHDKTRKLVTVSPEDDNKILHRSILQAAGWRDTGSHASKFPQALAPDPGSTGEGNSGNDVVMPTVNTRFLSERQWEVAELAAMGFSNAEIAARLFIDVTTVKSHLSDVFHKLQIRRRGQILGLLYNRDFANLGISNRK